MCVEHDADAGRRIELDHRLVGLWGVLESGEAEPRRVLEDQPKLRLRGREALAGANEEGDPGPAPVLDLEAEGCVRLRRRVRSDSVDRAVAVVLPAHVVRGVCSDDRCEERDHVVLDRLRIATRRRLHGCGADHLHEVIDDDVAQCAHGVVEVAAVVDPEVLCHRDLDGSKVVPVPDRLEHRVREAEVEDLVESHLPQVVVDPVELGLVDVQVEILRESAGGLQIVAEGLLDDHPGSLRQPCLGEPLDHGREEEGRDLEVEDRSGRACYRLCHSAVRRWVSEVALNVGESGREPLEDVLVEALSGSDDRFARACDQLLDRPVVDRDSDDRAIQQTALLEAIERAERHHPGEVAGDPERHEDVSLLVIHDGPAILSRLEYDCLRGRAQITRVNLGGLGSDRERDRRGRYPDRGAEEDRPAEREEHLTLPK